MSEQEPSKSYDPTEVERRWYPIWMERQYFRAEPSSARPPFCIVLPPPNVTGSLHLGHALTATIQDLLCRWKRMSGYNVLWLPGTDHAGIATQMVVERELKKTEGKTRHDLGRQAFLQKVWEWKEKYGARIGEQHKVLGASLDWSRERFTMDEASSAAVREVFVRLHEEGLIYRDQKLINWCPSCRTALSDLEVEHEEKDGSLWHIHYPVTGSDRKLTVATTRPETMLGDTAVAVHPEDERYKDLIGRTVTLPLVNREIPIIGDAELVNPEFGTGVVKVTPAHDFNDYQTGLRHKLPMINIFDDAARLNEHAGRFAGLDRFEARRQVIEALKEQGLFEKEEPHKLSIGGCQRCGTVVEPRLSPQWFVKIDPLAKPAIEAVESGKTRFIPETWTNVYFHWMRNIHDWCISRQLWWGHQIPAWYCRNPDCARKDQPIVAREAPAACPHCGKGLEQDEDVLDTWFSSALWPFSTLGWPRDTPELRTFYPTSVMETGHDIIFFWVARMMMMGLHFMKDVPFRTVYLHAMVRDEKGEKMSKVKGNVIDPLDVVRGAPKESLPPALKNKFPQGMPAFGADALRFTLAALTQQGRDIKLSLDRVAGYKAFVNKLWNASRFVLMNLGDFRADGTFIKGRPLSLADRWILSRLNRVISSTQEALEGFCFSDAANGLYQFLWYELCDWYIELSKQALYGDDAEAKTAARATLVFTLDHVLRLLHPFMPFVTEELWQKLPIDRDADSIMIAQWPVPVRGLTDDAAEAEMAPVIAAIEGIRTIRGESNLPPQARVSAVIQSADPALCETLRRWEHYLRPLAGLKGLTVGEPGPKPPQAAAHITASMEIYVPLAGLIDLDEERKRLQKEIARAEQELASISRRLESPAFVAKAPSEVVEKDRARVAELGAKKAKLEENLKRIAPEAPMSQQSNDPQQSGTPTPKDEIDGLVMAPEKASVKVAPPADGPVNLGEELAEDLAQVKVPPGGMDPQVRDALDKLREGTRDLSPKDRYDLGVAYMSMGLVDDAVREIAAAKEDEAGASAPPKPARSTAKKVGAKKKGPAKKAAPKKTSAKKAGTKKTGAKRSASSKAKASKGSRAKKGGAQKASGARAAARRTTKSTKPAKKASRGRRK
ncbi:MAG: valine--tRNA ligase [Myxococcaceae bacterium]|nr:valine--tRNA ligase [Myxococcaceae bacterium]